jgi:preprotein translocase subunit SecG
MTLFFLILVLLCAVVLGFIVLVQNPKGGGLQGNVGGFSNQFMGVKQTTDILEKGTWIFAGVIAVLCLASRLFFSSPTSNRTIDRTLPAPSSQQSAPAQQQPAQPQQR